MNVLHICNDYYGSKVHRNLYKSLDELEVNQIVYCPIKNTTVIKSNIVNYNFTKIIVSKTMRKSHRVLFKKKIDFLYKDLKSKINLSEIRIIHATNLFSDGAIAYRLFKDKKIPYIVAVRSTDIEVFLKYRPDLIHLAWSILNNAKKIIFISEALKVKFLNNHLIHLISKKSSHFKKNCHIQFNGIDDFWLNNPQVHNSSIKPTNILYVGSLLKRKNVVATANAIIKLNQSGINCRFNIVGKGGVDENKIKKLSLKYPNLINYIGPISDKEKLKSIYNRNQIFAMPSIGETFGLVYIEALSQGLPLLYSQNDGIYGVFKENIGEYCNPNDEIDIAKALKKIIVNYKTFEINKVDFEKFRWKNIAIDYEKIYKTIKT